MVLFCPPFGTHLFCLFLQCITLFADYMVELQLFPSTADALYLHLLPSFSFFAASADKAPFCCCTLICVCCQASPSLLIFSTYADEAAVKICSCWSAAARLPIPAHALLQLLLIKLLLAAGLEDCCCLISFHKTIVCDELNGNPLPEFEPMSS